MRSRKHLLKNGRSLVTREAEVEDARAILDYVERIGGESDFLSFGPGEFEWTESQEEDFLRQCRASDNQLYLVGWIDDAVVAGLNFSGGRRPRLRHAGEFGLSVRRAYWGLGIGSLMLDALFDWAREGGIITKINLRVRADNHRAIRLYERKGFVKEGTIRKDVFLNGVYYSQDWMRLEL